MRKTMPPKVLISDALSPAAVAIFKDRGVEVDFQPNLGKDKEKLAAAIDTGFDGLAIRSATKVTAKMLEAGQKPQSDLQAAPASVSTMSIFPPRPRAASS